MSFQASILQIRIYKPYNIKILYSLYTYILYSNPFFSSGPHCRPHPLHISKTLF